MTRYSDTIEADGYPIDALSRMSAAIVTPVLDNGRPVGIAARRDILGEEIILVEEDYGHEQRF